MHYPKNSEWVRRRWFDFRNGNSDYLRYGLAFSNTIIIAYFFLIEKVNFFGDFFPTVWIFAIIFLVGYIPISILVGAWHVKTQVRTEMYTTMEQKPLMAKTLRLLIRMARDDVSKEELVQMRNFLEKIEKKQID